MSVLTTFGCGCSVFEELVEIAGHSVCSVCCRWIQSVVDRMRARLLSSVAALFDKVIFPSFLCWNFCEAW